MLQKEQENIQQDILSGARRIALMLPNMLAEKPEEWPAELKEVAGRRMLQKELDGLQGLYEQLVGGQTLRAPLKNPTQDLHMRLMIAIRSLEHATQAFASIEAKVIKEMDFDQLDP